MNSCIMSALQFPSNSPKTNTAIFNNGPCFLSNALFFQTFLFVYLSYKRRNTQYFLELLNTLLVQVLSKSLKKFRRPSFRPFASLTSGQRLAVSTPTYYLCQIHTSCKTASRLRSFGSKFVPEHVVCTRCLPGSAPFHARPVYLTSTSSTVSSRDTVRQLCDG